MNRLPEIPQSLRSSLAERNRRGNRAQSRCSHSAIYAFVVSTAAHRAPRHSPNPRIFKYHQRAPYPFESLSSREERFASADGNAMHNPVRGRVSRSRSLSFERLFNSRTRSASCVFARRFTRRRVARAAPRFF